MEGMGQEEAAPPVIRRSRRARSAVVLQAPHLGSQTLSGASPQPGSSRPSASAAAVVVGNLSGSMPHDAGNNEDRHEPTSPPAGLDSLIPSKSSTNQLHITLCRHRCL